MQKKYTTHLATLITFAVILIFSLIIILWFAEVGTINSIFIYLNSLQENPPIWVKAPTMLGKFIFFPTIIFWLLAWLIIKASPQPRPWSRRIIILLLLTLAGRYLVWRSLSTLNLSNALNGFFSLSLFLMELLVLFNTMLQLFLMLKTSDRHREADQWAEAVISRKYQPTVDILIPTYNEPEFILKRTVIGCQALNYQNKTIYLLDDTNRSQIAKLAKTLGCEYLTRPDNLHAKAGNLNHALNKINAELIVVFDADFIPTRNFLERTIGFFQDPKVGLVQTPQSFYNTDPIARNLGLEEILTPEEEVFYRQIQPIKDAAGSVVCAGTSFVVRRTALEEIGGFVTESLSEDYFTGIQLSAVGYRLVYLNEKLSAGLAADNIAAHATQRIRWARGTLQGFFIRANPLTISGLTFKQRLAHLEGLLHWFNSFTNLVFLLMPMLYAWLGIIPIRATPMELVYFFLPYYLTQITVFSWLNYRSRSAILSAVYGLVLSFPLALTVIQVFLNPFGESFRVTPKGTKGDRFRYNWRLASPLLLIFVFTAISLWSNLCSCILVEVRTNPELLWQFRGISLGWIWSLYNLIILGAALLILLDVPNLDTYQRFQLRRGVKITVPSSPDLEFWGFTEYISEQEVCISLTTQEIGKLMEVKNSPVDILFLQEKMNMSGELVNAVLTGEFPGVRIFWHQLTLSQERQLIELLYCRPGQWQRQDTPGELASLLLLLKILTQPRSLRRKNWHSKAMRVKQV